MLKTKSSEVRVFFPKCEDKYTWILSFVSFSIMYCCRRYGEIVERKLIAISYLNEMKVSKQNISISENGQLEYQKFHRSCGIG